MTADGVGATQKEYASENPTYTRFVEEMKSAGYKVRPYGGRYEYRGPAVVTDDVEKVVAIANAVGVSCAYDELGKGFIVYPVTYEDWKHAREWLEVFEQMYPESVLKHLAVYPKRPPKA